MQTIELRYTLTADELKDFNYYVIWASPSKKKVKQNQVIKSVVIYLAFLYFFRTLPVNENFFIIYSVLFGGWMLYWFLTIRKRVNTQVDDAVKKYGIDVLLKETRLIIDETGVYSSDDVEESKLKWKGYINYDHYHGCHYLFSHPVKATIIPDRCLSDHQKQILEEFLSAYIPITAQLYPYHK